MKVYILWWSDTGAAADVDGVRVRIRANRAVTRWTCDECGERTNVGHCAHTEALANTDAEPDKYKPSRVRKAS